MVKPENWGRNCENIGVVERDIPEEDREVRDKCDPVWQNPAVSVDPGVLVGQIAGSS